MNNQIEGIVIHWTASSWTIGIKDIEHEHKVVRKWPRIAYHRVILNELSKDINVPDHSKLVWSDLVKATIDLDNDQWLENNEIGFHTAEMNKKMLAVSVCAGPGYPPSPLQIVALRNVVSILQERYKLKKENVFGHRDFGMNENKGLALADDLHLTDKAARLNTTECPGDILYKEVQAFRGLAKPQIA